MDINQLHVIYGGKLIIYILLQFFLSGMHHGYRLVYNSFINCTMEIINIQKPSSFLYSYTFALTISIAFQEWLEVHLPVHWTFHTYLTSIDPPSGQCMDHVLPSCLTMMLERHITVRHGKDMWQSNDELGADIVLRLVGKTFMATKVGKCLFS